MFNIYYINYEKAYQIAMLIDNKIIETKQKEKEGKFNTTGNGNSSLGSFDEIPFIGKYMPKIEIKGEMAGSKSHKVIDTVKVISTKSTILRETLINNDILSSNQLLQNFFSCYIN